MYFCHDLGGNDPQIPSEFGEVVLRWEAQGGLLHAFAEETSHRNITQGEPASGIIKVVAAQLAVQKPLA